MQKTNYIYTLNLEDLLLEAVLDEGFSGSYSFSSTPHTHAYYELILAVSGQIRIEPAELVLENNRLCLIPPGFYHRICRGSENAQKLAIRFCCRQKGKGGIYAPFTAALGNVTSPAILSDQSRLAATLADLRKELQTDYAARKLFAQNLLQQIFILLYRELCREDRESKPLSNQDEAIRRLQIEEYLLDNFKNSITEQDLADYMHLSKRQVSRVLDAIYGRSFRRLLIDMRLQEAARLLRETSIPIELIASQIGYTSISGFYHAFQKTYGITAGNYRKTYKTLP